MRYLFSQFIKHASSVDGKFMRSWRSLLGMPGQLTAAFVSGERRRYITPLALFFIGNAAFVGVQSLTGTNILASPLASHLHSQDWSSFAQDLVSDRLAKRQLSLDAYAPVFDRSALFNAKALVILMALLFAPLPAILFRGRDRPGGAHIVFALHLYAFVLILLSVSVLLAWLDERFGGQGLSSGLVDKTLSLFNLVVCGGYLYLAIGKVYLRSGWARSLSALFLTMSVAMLFIGYRFAIFLITFYTT
ncbi:MAG: DUF3667 domain-containing protein [Sphingomonas sp.]